MALPTSRRLLWAATTIVVLGSAVPATLAHADVSPRRQAVLEAARTHRPVADADAAATPQHVATDVLCRNDVTGDVADGRADIREWCVYIGDDEVRVAMDLVDNTDPATHPAWDGFTAATWIFDVPGGETVEYTVLLIEDIGGVVHFDLVDEDGDLVCEPTRSQANTDVYQASFAASCLAGVDSAEVAALMFFDSSSGSGDDGELHIDAAPDAGPTQMTRHTHQGTPNPGPTEVAGNRVTGRISGAGRMETAVAVSQRAFPNGSAVVYLAAQDVNPDALVAGALSDGPVLLVPSCGALPQVVADEIRRLGARAVYALGGVNSVCEQMLSAAAAA